MAAQLDFILSGPGWATIEISAGNFIRQIDRVSYTTDPLDDLLRMGIDIATDKGWTFAELDHEPAITVLVAETGWWEEDGWKSGARLSAFQQSRETSCVNWKIINEAKRDFVLELQSRDELASLFSGAAERVLDRHGPEGYATGWGGRLGFPTRALTALQAALSCTQDGPLNYRA